MSVLGYVDHITRREIVGWAADTTAFNVSVTVEVIAEGKVIASGPACLYREDLKAARLGDGRHSFRIEIPDLPDGMPISCRIRGSDTELPRSQSSIAPPSLEAHLHHPLRFGLPSPAYGFKETPAPEGAEVVVKRLLQSFKAVGERDTGKRGEIWGHIVREFHQELYEILNHGNDYEIRDYLYNAPARKIGHGFFEGEAGYHALKKNREQCKKLAVLYFDHLVSLAEALGCIPVQCPEQGPWTGNFENLADELVQLIEVNLGIDISPPAGINSYFGVATVRGYLNFRIIDAIYAAWRIQNLVKNRNGSAVCEIGGGIGLVAYYAIKLGIANYTIIDLPSVNVLQAFMLDTSVARLDLQLYGERVLVRNGSRVQILPPPSLREIPVGSLDLVFMQDNMPEFERNVALGYLGAFKDLGVPRVLSINQEAQVPVNGIPQNLMSDLFAEIGGFQRTLRMRHWMRVGYVEEIYERERSGDVDEK
jgi:hypothetical protein